MTEWRHKVKIASFRTKSCIFITSVAIKTMATYIKTSWAIESVITYYNESKVIILSSWTISVCVCLCAFLSLHNHYNDVGLNVCTIYTNNETIFCWFTRAFPTQRLGALSLNEWLNNYLWCVYKLIIQQNG